MSGLLYVKSCMFTKSSQVMNSSKLQGTIKWTDTQFFFWVHCTTEICTVSASIWFGKSQYYICMLCRFFFFLRNSSWDTMMSRTLSFLNRNHWFSRLVAEVGCEGKRFWKREKKHTEIKSKVIFKKITTAWEILCLTKLDRRTQFKPW